MVGGFCCNETGSINFWQMFSVMINKSFLMVYKVVTNAETCFPKGCISDPHFRGIHALRASDVFDPPGVVVVVVLFLRIKASILRPYFEMLSCPKRALLLLLLINFV